MKILLTGNLFFDYEHDILFALQELGHEVDMLFHNIFGPFQLKDVKTIPEWLKYGVLPHKLKINFFTNQSTAKYNKEVARLLTANKYDLMLVVGAKSIYPETISMYKGPKVLWFMDGLPRYEYVMPKVPLFDHVFLFEWTDVPLVKEKFNIDATFLTLGFNPQKYYPKKNAQQYDLSFVGAFYPKRDQYLGALLSVSKNMAICGDFYRSKNSELKSKILKIKAPADYVCDVYNATKINMNIHHPQSKEGLSVRSFEILGSGGFQLVERQRAAVLFFEEDKEIAFYDSVEECLDKAKYYLKNDTKRVEIAKNGYKAAMANHTWTARLKELLDNVKNNA